MGYNTRFSLSWNQTSVKEDILDALNKNSNMKYALGSDAKSGDPCKWYRWKDDMRTFSKNFPDVLFTLCGKGEENDDIWEADFQNGKMKFRKAQIIIPKFEDVEWT